MSSLFLGFFGDGQKHDNIVMTCAYGSGVTYPRPFRYSDRRVDPALLARGELRETLTGRQAVLGMRFFDTNHEWHFLPIRKATITHTETVEGLHLITFLLMEFFTTPEGDDLAASVVELPQTDRPRLGSDVILFESEVDPVGTLVDDADERGHWHRRVDAYANTTLPIHGDARRAVYCWVGHPLPESKPNVREFAELGRGDLQRAWNLREGRDYVVPVDYRVPSVIGGNTGFKGLAYVLESEAGGSVSASPRQLVLSSNYDQVRPRIDALRPTGIERLELVPSGDSVTASDQSDIFALRIPILLGVSRDPKYRLRSKWLPTAALWLLLFLSLVITRALSAPEGSESVLSPGTLLLLALAAGVAITHKWLDGRVHS